MYFVQSIDNNIYKQQKFQKNSKSSGQIFSPISASEFLMMFLFNIS